VAWPTVERSGATTPKRQDPWRAVDSGGAPLAQTRMSSRKSSGIESSTGDLSQSFGADVRVVLVADPVLEGDLSRPSLFHDLLVAHPGKLSKVHPSWTCPPRRQYWPR
jgi:hypothetical protein